MKEILQVICFLGFFLVNSKVDCEDIQPTFKYVTSYNRNGRFMTKSDIEKTSVNVLKPIIFIIDGLTDEDKRGDIWNKDLQDAYLQKLIHNVFIVDWNLTSPSDSASINKARSVGLAVADFIETIFNKTGETYLDIHLVGISLGYEVAASAARRVSELSGRKINRITGLDPAYYSIINEEADSQRLPEEKADFVDVIQSNLRGSAELKQVGSVDFYVDDVDDNCDIKGSESCGVLKSAKLFAKSINSNDIKARKCDSLERFRQGLCSGEEEIIFGENVSKLARGKYFIKY